MEWAPAAARGRGAYSTGLGDGGALLLLLLADAALL